MRSGDIKRKVVRSGQLDVFRTRDLGRQITSRVNGHTRVADPMQHQRWHSNRRENVTRINFTVHLEYCDRGRRTRGRPFPGAQGHGEKPHQKLSMVRTILQKIRRSPMHDQSIQYSA